MIRPEEFYNELSRNNINFFTGVPDSLLKDFCAYITDNVPKERNIIAVNEGNAIALAAGHYLATKEIGLVYMQNSGLGNATNPLLSLVDPKVYSIPMLLLIGWRGEPGKKDEPQHIKQGEITLDLLKAMKIEYEVLTESEDDMEQGIKKAVAHMNTNKGPYALVVPKGIFDTYKFKNPVVNDYDLSREEAIELIISNIDSSSAIISTTGKTSRELFELRKQLDQGNEKDFLTVGSMGHSLSIATSIALSQPNKNIYCIDGDGSMLMHMGGLAIAGAMSPQNLKYIVINNGAHDSVGGQPTVAFNIDMQKIAKGCGYSLALRAETKEELLDAIKKLDNLEGLGFLEIRVNNKSRSDLGRPTTSPMENKEGFMEFLAMTNS